MTRFDEGLKTFVQSHEAPSAERVDRDGARESARAAIAKGRRLRAVRGGGVAAMSVAALALAGVGIAQANGHLGTGPGDATAVHVGAVEPLDAVGIDAGSPWELCGTVFSPPVMPGVTVSGADAAAPDFRVYVTQLGDGPAVAGDSMTVSRQYPAGVVVSYAPPAGPGAADPAVMAVLVDDDDTVVAVATDIYGVDLAPELGVAAIEGQRGVWEAVVDEMVCPQFSDSSRERVVGNQVIIDPLEGTYTLHVLAQFYGPDGDVEATFYDYGIGRGVAVTFDQSEVLDRLAQQERRTTNAQAEIEDYVSSNGVPLTSAYRGAGFAEYRSTCEWVEVATGGIDTLQVGQLFRYDTLPRLSEAPPRGSGVASGLAWSGGTDGVAWWDGIPGVVLFFDEDGRLASAVAFDGSTWVSEAASPPESFAPLAVGEGCGGVSAELPTRPGTYTPVLVVPDPSLDRTDLPAGSYSGAPGALTGFAILGPFEVS